MILSDSDIQRYMQSGDITIRSFSGNLEPASYDLRVGLEGLSDAGRVDLATDGYMTIPRGATVVVYPLEEISLSVKVVARYGLRSRFARKGLILLSGPQIDPGFGGRLGVTIFNAGTAEVSLSSGEPFATVEFSLLSSPASKGYAGPYQGQQRVSTDEVEVITRKYKNFSEIEDSLRGVESEVRFVRNFLVWVVLALVVGIAIALTTEFLRDDEPSPLESPSPAAFGPLVTEATDLT
jgi:dCTP deaminase